MNDQRSSDYAREGYTHLAGFIPPQVATGFLARMRADFARQGIGFDKLMKPGPLLRQPAAEVYGYHYVPLAMFHWGMTPAVEALVGEPVLPTYSYFRMYR